MPDPISSTARTRAALLAPAMAILIFAAAGPLVIVLIYSFLTPGDYGGVVWDFSTDAWFGVLAERDFFTEELSWADAHLTVFWRSIKLSLLTALLSFIFGFPTAYFIATRPRRSRDIWMLLVMIPFWTNLLIRTFAIMELIRNEGTINTVLIAMGLVTQPVQMLYTEFSLLLGMTYVYLPLMILPIYASMERFDFKLVEAGYDLYATRWQVLRRVILPIVKPGIVAGSILVFVPCLGAYVTPRVLGGGKQLMLGNLIELQFGQLRNWPLGAALSLTLLVIVMVALIFYVRTVGTEERSHG
ncbi:spermidine/putrescine ABC transporter permease [Roseivivax marinus]|uniref:Spermidine/putrescine ABC transporter permease n=1 Tax=Roseivivax marinus TaxID=1379903 RepID=W4HKR1_9RHOB|nr:ABC transporter permease [Roseivivax marinus]ETW12993.1 spermidine/putrescine ABC transporter permease [Roseivivax marinus]UMA64456.1 ABC transporter permease [Roseivivax marinus]SEL82822.1 spermidine/putrescine transport system permease protein [Roseivivax marinus]